MALISSLQLNLPLTLLGGQSFRWKPTTDGHYLNVIGSWIFRLYDSSESINCQVLDLKGNQAEGKHLEEGMALIKDHLHLNVDLDELYKRWSKDDVFKRVVSTEKYKGIRILNIDPTENLFCFIISQNNNIPRITKLTDKLCEVYGQYCTEIDGIKLYTFPRVETIAKEATEQDLRNFGFGYRAKYIVSSAQRLLSDSRAKGFKSVDEYLKDLSKFPYEHVKEELLKLHGIGPKVADCISLFSMRKYGVIPVDTHVRGIAERYYGYRMKSASMTPQDYGKIQNIFVNSFGEYAGWAHSVLFIADLRYYQDKENNEEKRKKPRTK